MHKRCPRGYHLERQVNGTYYVYTWFGYCVGGAKSKADAIHIAWDHYDAKRNAEFKAVLDGVREDESQ